MGNGDMDGNKAIKGARDKRIDNKLYELMGPEFLTEPRWEGGPLFRPLVGPPFNCTLKTLFLNLRQR